MKPDENHQPPTEPPSADNALPENIEMTEEDLTHLSGGTRSNNYYYRPPGIDIDGNPIPGGIRRRPISETE